MSVPRHFATFVGEWNISLVSTHKGLQALCTEHDAHPRNLQTVPPPAAAECPSGCAEPVERLQEINSLIAISAIFLHVEPM
jgi:hypothetical protein